jgi:hypothetical protein
MTLLSVSFVMGGFFMTRLSSFGGNHIFIRRCCVLHPLSFEFVIPCEGLRVFPSRPQRLFRKFPFL